MSCLKTLDLTIYKGITFGPLLIHLRDVRNDPVILTSWTLYAEVRASASDAVIADLEPTITDAANGTVSIERTDEQTASLTAGEYLWDLIGENASGERVGPIVSGALIITSPITQPV